MTVAKLIFLAACIILLSTGIIIQVTSATSSFHTHDSIKCYHHNRNYDSHRYLHRSSSSSRRRRRNATLSPYCSSIGENSAFIFTLMKGRRGDGTKSQTLEEQPQLLVPDDKIINGDTNSINNGNFQNTNVNGHKKYNLGSIANGQHYDHNGRDNTMDQLLDIDIVEDEPYVASMHPIQNMYNTLSSKLSSFAKEGEDLQQEGLDSAVPLEDVSETSLDSLEGTNDNTVSYTNLSAADGGKDDIMAQRIATQHTPIINGDTTFLTANEDDSSKSSLWSKRNARSIDEGIRFKEEKNGFKTQLREGLEEQTKQHRERLLSDLLEGFMGGGKYKSAAMETVDSMKNVTKHPFRWLGFGRGESKDKDGGDDTLSVDKDTVDSATISTSPVDATTTDDVDISSSKDNRPNNRRFGARTIAGLIMALAEEVEGLEVEVDADPKTPIYDKTVHSIKIYFSRLGFRQLRMGGLDEVFTELESSMKPSEKFTMASNFLNNIGGKPTTADEAFDKIDVDNSGALDEEELAQALKMAAVIGGNAKFGMRSKKETLTELASRLIRLYDTNGDGVVDREEYQAMVQDMAALRDARSREEMHEQTDLEVLGKDIDNGEKKRGWLSNIFGANNSKGSDESISNTTANGDNNIIDVTENDDVWGAIDQGEGSIVLEDLQLDLRRLLFGAIPGVKRILPGGPLILKPFTATLTASFTPDDLMESVLLDMGLRRLVARALSRRVRSIRDLLDGAVFYGRTWKLFEQNAPLVEVAKLEDVQFDHRDRLVVTGRAKIQEALGYKHKPIEQGFKLRCRIGTRANGQIIGLQQAEIAVFAECPKDWERTVRAKCKEWFDYTIPSVKPLYTYIPLVSPIKKNDKMDGFNMGEDNAIKSIYIKNGKLRFEMSAFLRPGRFLGNHYLAFTVPNRTLILTLGRVKDAMRNARKNKRLAELAAKEVQRLAATKEGDNDVDIVLQSSQGKNYLSPEGKVRIRKLEKELKATIQEEAILREIEDGNKENNKSFISRFVAGWSGAIREEIDLEMNARLSSSISDFFGSQGSKEGEDEI